MNFYPRSPRGERPGVLRMGRMMPNFYPRSPRGERLGAALGLAGVTLFLSTLPARGATGRKVFVHKGVFISIHAPREGSDPLVQRPAIMHTKFLSTLPARGATT